MDDNSQYILSSLDNALSVLNLFFDHETLTAAQTAQLLGVSRTAAFRLLVTLEARGFLTRSEDSSYRLGIKIFSLGQLAQRRMVLTELIHPYLNELSDKTGETAHLAVMDGAYNVVFVDKALGSLYLKMDTILGYRRLAHQTATGKSMLAWQSAELIDKYISTVDMAAITENTITTGKLLKNELAAIRSQGWACDNEESEIGLTCFAVPVFTGDATPVAAISCSGPSSRLIIKKDKILFLLQNAAQNINAAIKQ